jgi:hypothetical protein
MLTHKDLRYFKCRVPCPSSLVRLFQRIPTISKSYSTVCKMLGCADSSYPTPKMRGPSLVAVRYWLLRTRIYSVTLHIGITQHDRVLSGPGPDKHNSAAARSSVTSDLNAWHEEWSFRLWKCTAGTEKRRLLQVSVNSLMKSLVVQGGSNMTRTDCV